MKQDILPSVIGLIETMKDENVSARLMVKAGELCFELEQFRDAEYFFKKALTLEPMNSDALNDLGVLTLQFGNVHTAEELFAKAIGFDANNHSAKKNLTLLYEKLKRNDDPTAVPEENAELSGMKEYWDACARHNAMRHIACDNWESEKHFHACGERDFKRLLSNLDEGFFKKKNIRALEIGCGIGRLLKPFAAQYPCVSIYGVDVSEEMIRKGKERLTEFKNVQLFRNSGKDLRMFKDNYFHFIYSSIVFQHIPKKFVRYYFNEIGRVLKGRGLLVFQMPLISDNMQRDELSDTDFRTVRHYSVKEVEALCRSNRLEIIKEDISAASGIYCGSGRFTARKVSEIKVTKLKSPLSVRNLTYMRGKLE